jgi:asparagine synthetase B (glutamine-hydrolysing)
MAPEPTVRYRAADGTVGTDLLGLAGPRPRFSLAKLAAYFTWPALRLDLRPDVPWNAVSRVQPAQARAGTSDAAEFRDRFDASVRACAGSAGKIAVAFDGGADSAAVLIAAARLCATEGRELMAVTVDLSDGTGRRAAALATVVIDRLRLRCEQVRVRPEPTKWGEPDWHPVGPCLDATPRYHRAVSELAHRGGAQVLLHGTGADQLLRAPSYLAPDLIRSGRLAEAGQYLAGRWKLDHRSPIAELMPLMVPRLRTVSTARLYHVLSCPYPPGQQVSGVLAGPWPEAARNWLSELERASLRQHLQRRWSWSRAACWEQMFPADRLVPATDLPEHSPFRQPDFVAYGLGLPPPARFSGTGPTPQRREKYLVLRLLPAEIRNVLPPGTLPGYRGFEAYWKTVGGDAPLLRELGLVPADWRRRCRDAFDLRMVSACETWVRQACERGAEAG